MGVETIAGLRAEAERLREENAALTGDIIRLTEQLENAQLEVHESAESYDEMYRMADAAEAKAEAWRDAHLQLAQTTAHNIAATLGMNRQLIKTTVAGFPATCMTVSKDAVREAFKATADGYSHTLGPTEVEAFLGKLGIKVEK